MAGIVGVISGGPASGDLMRARKEAIREAIRLIMSPVAKPWQHNLTISNFWVKKILIDSKISVDVLFHGAFSQMEVDNERLTPVNTSLTSFSGDVVEPLGEVSLPVSLGSYPRRATKFIKFLVVDSHSGYNVYL
ncbi:UNVERIFIED_CONTAM: hypothetical protein Sradi_5730800, partial [Sesamum radiatum]